MTAKYEKLVVLLDNFSSGTRTSPSKNTSTDASTGDTSANTSTGTATAISNRLGDLAGFAPGSAVLDVSSVRENAGVTLRTSTNPVTSALKDWKNNKTLFLDSSINY